MGNRLNTNPWPLGLLALLGLALAGYLVYPYYLLSRGTAQLTTALTAPDKAERLTTAITSLEHARARLPTDMTILRRLAQAYLAAERPHDAVAALEEARRVMPTSLLVSAELIDGYLATGQLTEASALLVQLGVTADLAEQKANQALTQGDGAEARRWLLRTIALDPERTATMDFRRAAAALLAGASASESKQLAAQANFTIYPLDKPTRIPANELRWLIDMRQYGVFFGDRTLIGAPPDTGVLWWGARAMTAIDVPVAGTYQLRLRAYQDQPPPIQLSVEINDQLVINTALTRGDHSWALIESSVELQAGPQALVVRFLNDGSVDGKDRNLTLSWVELAPIQP